MLKLFSDGIFADESSFTPSISSPKKLGCNFWKTKNFFPTVGILLVRKIFSISSKTFSHLFASNCNNSIANSSFILLNSLEFELSYLSSKYIILPLVLLSHEIIVSSVFFPLK